MILSGPMSLQDCLGRRLPCWMPFRRRGLFGFSGCWLIACHWQGPSSSLVEIRPEVWRCSHSPSLTAQPAPQGGDDNADTLRCAADFPRLGEFRL